MFQRLKPLRELPGYAWVAWRLFQDPRVPFRLKAVLFIAVLAVFAPLDLLDWLPIPVAGPASTLALLVLVLRTFINAVPEELRLEHMAAVGIELE